MAVQAQFGGLVLPPYAAAEEQQMRALKDYGALLSGAAPSTPAGADDAYAWQQYDYCAAQSELTCNNGHGGVAAVPVPSRKRVREDDDADLLHYASFLPLQTAMRRQHSATAAPASTSGRPAEAPAAAPDALASELWRHGDAEVDAVVRAECDRLRAALEAARKRQRQALVRAAVSGLARRAREAESQLEAARRRAAELEERVRLAAAEAQAWCGVARGNEAVAAGLRATLDALLLRAGAGAGVGCGAGQHGAEEGFGESGSGGAGCGAEDDAESCCFVDRAAAAAAEEDAVPAAAPAAKWACRACGYGEASVLVLPCRHLCLCKACEPRTEACPVCAGAKNAALHIAPN